MWRLAEMAGMRLVIWEASWNTKQVVSKHEAKLWKWKATWLKNVIEDLATRVEKLILGEQEVSYVPLTLIYTYQVTRCHNAEDHC
jgi:hypothetical protein